MFNEEEYKANADEVLSTLEELEQEEAEETQYTEEVWGKAMQRIEEANLFKLLIKDSIFQSGSASPQILNSVNKKIKSFAIKELENLLGIPSKEEHKESQTQFDKEEVMALKVLASSVLKRSVGSTAPQVVDKVPKLNTIAVETPERNFPKKKSIQTKLPIQKQESIPIPVQSKNPVKTKKIGEAPAKGEFAKPTRHRPTPMPKPNQLMANVAPAGIALSEGSAPLGAGNQALLSQIVGQLSKTQVHVDTGVAETDSANERF